MHKNLDKGWLVKRLKKKEGLKMSLCPTLLPSFDIGPGNFFFLHWSLHFVKKLQLIIILSQCKNKKLTVHEPIITYHAAKYH